MGTPREDSDGQLFKNASCYLFFIFLLVHWHTTRHVGVTCSDDDYGNFIVTSLQNMVDYTKLSVATLVL